jgi:hypothetical protein
MTMPSCTTILPNKLTQLAEEHRINRLLFHMLVAAIGKLMFAGFEFAQDA